MADITALQREVRLFRQLVELQETASLCAVESDLVYDALERYNEGADAAYDAGVAFRGGLREVLRHGSREWQALAGAGGALDARMAATMARLQDDDRAHLRRDDTPDTVARVVAQGERWHSLTQALAEIPADLAPLEARAGALVRKEQAAREAVQAHPLCKALRSGPDEWGEDKESALGLAMVRHGGELYHWFCGPQTPPAERRAILAEASAPLVALLHQARDVWRGFADRMDRADGR